MPEISRFFGIVIRMFLDDHNPSHFHAKYAEFEAVIAIEDLKIIEGKFTSEGLWSCGRMGYNP